MFCQEVGYNSYMVDYMFDTTCLIKVLPLKVVVVVFSCLMETVNITDEIMYIFTEH